MQVGKEEVKLPLLPNDMILYVEHLKIPHQKKKNARDDK